MTTGMNAVISGLSLQPQEVVCCLSLTYGSTKKILTNTCIRSGAKVHIIQLNLPITSKQDMVEKIKESVTSLHPLTPKAIILDQITSNTALRLPIKEIAQVCREFGMKIIIDAAHMLNMEKVDIYRRSKDSDSASASGSNGGGSASNGSSVSNINTTGNNDVIISEIADYWIANCHKWLCSPKGAAFMWCKKGMEVPPRIISHGYSEDDSSRTLSAFSWDGCRDYASLLTVPSTLQCWQLYLPDASAYNNQLLIKARNMLLYNWEIDVDRDVPCKDDELLVNSMCLIPLPTKLGSYQQLSYTPSFSSSSSSSSSSPSLLIPTDVQAFQLQELLHHDHQIEVPVKCLEGRLYVRISCHVYNYIEEYKRLSTVIQRLMK